VAGAEVNPNGNTRHFQNPERVTNADFSCASELIGTCQYPLTKSKVLKYLLPDSVRKLSSIRGSG
jgi:hypothetical protein